MAEQHRIRVVLVRTKFPENIGMAARACANMGAGELVLVNPTWWDRGKAEPLATPKGIPILDSMRICQTLDEALSDTVLSFGTTARLGGWRRDFLTPEAAAREAAADLEAGPVAFVFGSEDKGLDNSEIERCSRLVTIPTDGASSLNLAQAVLVCAYECMKARSGSGTVTNDIGAGSRRITHAELECLIERMKLALLELDYLKGANPDYFLMPVRRFLGRRPLHRHEMDMLMGICRQIGNLAERAGVDRSGKMGGDAEDRR